MSKKKPGPTTPQGKLIASQNAAKHLMTGRVLVLPNEKQSDLDALVAQWQEEYPTQTVEAAKLVQEAAHSEWILLRVQRQSDQTLVHLFQTGMDAWGEADHKRYQLTQRYLTAAERKLERNRRLIWQYRRELRAEARELREAQRFAGRQDNEDGQESASTPEPAKKNDMPMRQIAVVSVENGHTITTFQPTNEAMLRVHPVLLETTLVTREILFKCDELPAEYAWCAPELAQYDLPITRQAVMVYHTQRTFVIALEREAAGGGHVKEWPDLYAQDKQFIEPAIAK